MIDKYRDDFDVAKQKAINKTREALKAIEAANFGDRVWEHAVDLSEEATNLTIHAWAKAY